MNLASRRTIVHNLFTVPDPKVMQERLKLSGMKWIVDNAEALLALRSKIKSETWDDKVVPLIRKQYTMR